MTPPGSKSITNRAIAVVLADGESHLSGVLDSEDTQVMIAAWQQVGVAIEHDVANHCLRIVGRGGQLPCAPGGIVRRQ